MECGSCCDRFLLSSTVGVRIEEHTLGPSIRVPEVFARQLNAFAALGVRDFGVALVRVA